MPKEEPSIGMGIREARKRLVELILERAKVAAEMLPLIPKSPVVDISAKYLELSDKIHALDNDIIQVREWYNIGLSESLYHESKRLNTLTIVLIGLTAILSVLTIVDILSRVIIHA
jgi:hypothetical protein